MQNQIFDIKRSVSFSLEKRKDSQGVVVLTNVPVRMTVTYNSNRITFFTGYRVDAKKWDAAKQRVKANTTNEKGETSTQVNGKLNNLEAGINEYFKGCEVKRYMPITKDVKEAFSLLLTQKKQQTSSFFKTFDDFVKTVGQENDWGVKSFEKFQTVRNHLVSFDKNLSFENLTSDRFQDFVNHLRLVHDLRNTTISKKIDFVKWFLRWAAKQKHPVNQTALDFRPKLKGTDDKIKKVIFLTNEELIHLNSFPIPDSKQYLQRVRDLFIFSAFSGFRYSDMYNLKKSNIKGNYIEFVTQKTSETLIVELNKFTRAVLEKYKDIPFDDNKALPVISNQRYNTYLKELGQMVGLDTPETIVYFKGSKRIEETYPKYALLSSHSGRKSFVTNLIYMGVSDNVIKEWTGHKDNKSFSAYHKIVNDIKSREMAKFDNL